MANIKILQGISVGDQITAKMLNGMTQAINENVSAISAPTQKIEVVEQSDAVADEVFSCTVTESTQTATDSAGDTVDIERVDTVTCTEDSTGRTMTLNITYA